MKQQESNFKYFVSIMLTLIGLITSGLGGLGVYLKDNSYSLFLLLHGKLTPEHVDFIPTLGAVILVFVLGILCVVCVVVLLFSMKKIWDETKAKYSIPNQAAFIELSDKVIKLEKQVNKLKSNLKKYKNNDRVLMRTFIIQKIKLLKAKEDRIKANLTNKENIQTNDNNDSYLS